MIQIFLFVRCTTDSAVVVYVSNGSDEYQLLGGTQFRYVQCMQLNLPMTNFQILLDTEHLFQLLFLIHRIDAHEREIVGKK